jgi:Putative zincin peptidase
MLERTSSDPINGDRRAEEIVYVIGLDRALTLRLAAYSMVLLFLSAGVFSAIVGSDRFSLTTSKWIQPLLYIVVYFAVVVLHELVHGLVFRYFGGHPQYGAGIKYYLPYFYATSPGDAFSVRQMVMIALAPLLTISIGALLTALLLVPVFPVLVGYFAVAFIGNTAGAVGDVWMTTRLIKFLPIKDARVFDRADSIAIHSHDRAAEQIARKLSAQDRRSMGFIVHWITATLVILTVDMLVMLIAPLFTDNLLIGPPQLPLIEFGRTGTGIVWTINLLSPLLAGLAFAIAVHLCSPRRSRPQ